MSMYLRVFGLGKSLLAKNHKMSATPLAVAATKIISAN